ncbi:hypothetical protein GCM10010518_47150 [Kitasatospora cinereorecta]
MKVTGQGDAAWGDSVARRARVRGALLGGAIGDALGNPVEFLSLDGIRRAHGERGVRELVADADGVVGRITDDTRMTLFTVEGLIRAHARARSKGVGCAETELVRNAYRRWLDTQNHPAPPVRGGADSVRTGWLRQQPWLYARRAPGNACLTGLAVGHVAAPGTPLGVPGPVNPAAGLVAGPYRGPVRDRRARRRPVAGVRAAGGVAGRPLPGVLTGHGP